MTLRAEGLLGDKEGVRMGTEYRTLRAAVHSIYGSDSADTRDIMGREFANFDFVLKAVDRTEDVEVE